MLTMPEKKKEKLDRLYNWLIRFLMFGVFIGILSLSFVLLNLFSKLESFAPAEFHLLLDILKNRFFR